MQWVSTSTMWIAVQQLSRNTALLGGQVDFIHLLTCLSSQAYVDSGDFRFIAIDGDERFELAPDVPTFKEQGVDFSFAAQPMVVLAPKGTPSKSAGHSTVCWLRFMLTLISLILTGRL